MFKKRHPPPGARPGTLMISERAVAPRITAFRYTPEAVERHPVDDPEALAALHAATDSLLWVDVQGLGDEATLRSVAKTFSIHPLALEDVVNAPQRPKTERYEDHQLYISRMVHFDDAGEIEIEQVTILFGRDYVVTFQELHGDVLDPVRERLRQGAGPIRRSGPDYLAYAIIDTIIDFYYPVIETVSEELESLEARVLSDPSSSTLGAVNRMRRVLLDLRRGIWPQRDAINALVRGDSPFVTETVRVYLRDSYDHAVQITDVIETYREIAGGLFSTYLSVIGNRTNDVMKVLTIMASIFIPLTFMAGIYGMNFESMPELHSPWGYPALLGAMTLTAGVMLWYFRRLGWIGKKKS